ncbi:MAG TPA: acyl carrier protein [Trebonia sp.]
MAERTEILAVLIECMKKATEGDLPEEITEEKSLEGDLNLDSLTKVEVAVVAEGELGVRIPDDALPSLVTVGDLVSYIAGRSPSLSVPAAPHRGENLCAR